MINLKNEQAADISKEFAHECYRSYKYNEALEHYNTVSCCKLRSCTPKYLLYTA